INGTAASLARSEVAAHVQAGYVIASGKIVAAIVGGPTYFVVSQDLVSDVSFSEAYPYDTTAFSAATKTKASSNRIGFNVGCDIGVKFSQNVGVGGILRFSRTSVSFPAVGSAASVTTDAGGFQGGGGIRFY